MLHSDPECPSTDVHFATSMAVSVSSEREKRERRPKRRTRLGLACFAFAAVSLSCMVVFALRIWPSSVTDRRLSASLRSSPPRRETSLDDDSLRLKHLSNEFPSLHDSAEMARLSGLVYSFLGHDACNATNLNGEPLLPSDLTCHMYNHSQKQGTQVMVLSSRSRQYIAVVYAGTDDLRTTLTDGDILMKPFGPLDPNGDSILLPGPARVHAGFDNAIFETGLYLALLDLLTDLLRHYPRYRLFTTGHSLGAADSILTAVALAQHFSDIRITSISFGCPNTGNWHWRNAVHDLGSRLAIWRFVHGTDAVPRLPLLFDHVGHTVQMEADSMKAYYLHYGNQTLGYEGVPMGWSAIPFIWIPGAVWSHSILRYEWYLRNESTADPFRYYVNEFETIPSNGTTAADDDDADDGGIMEDDAWINPPKVSAS